MKNNLDIDLTPLLVQKMTRKSRVIGRYSASEIWSIVNGYISPHEWLNPQVRGIEENIKMWKGIGSHNQIQSLLKKDRCEIKEELVYKTITLVGIADYLPEDSDEVWEFKSSDSVMKKAKAWHKHQTKLYCTLFQKRDGKIFQPLHDNRGVYLKHVGSVERSDSWVAEELEKVIEFDGEVRKICYK